MLLIFILCLFSPSRPHISEDPKVVTVPIAGNALLPCGEADLPLNVNFQLEGKNNTWLKLEANYTTQDLDFILPNLLMLQNQSLEDYGNFSCFANNQTKLTNEAYNYTKDTDNVVFISCPDPQDWTSLSWMKNLEVIMTFKRGSTANRLHMGLYKGKLYLFIPTVTTDDAGIYICIQGDNQTTRVMLNITGYLELSHNRTGFEIFLNDGYWIISAVSLGYLAFCSTIMGCYMHVRQKLRTRREAKNRFFRVNTARNLYTNSLLSQIQGTNVKLTEITYQNCTEVIQKEVDNDHYSDKSSFMDESLGEASYLEPDKDKLSQGEASYLEPDKDKLSQGESYENANQETVDEVSLEDEDYENANEEIKDGSEGSQSYEDMKGSIYLKPTPNETDEQGEDADSYENMDAAIFSNPNHSLDSLKKTPEVLPADVCQEKSLSCRLKEAINSHHQERMGTELTQENGDFYMPYDGRKV
ncbi:B-lymphocyte antigen CD19 [Bombina bombina]|uniref:B-lymphocyte antigen CD19 n=1 Tax=Bombina bombina TaxID=8345 RepID=UPI00235B1F5C|nr:B-lymphocyte antigen CD19 [Bombina bombina]